MLQVKLLLMQSTFSTWLVPFLVLRAIRQMISQKGLRANVSCKQTAKEDDTINSTLSRFKPEVCVHYSELTMFLRVHDAGRLNE